MHINWEKDYAFLDNEQGEIFYMSLSVDGSFPDDLGLGDIMSFVPRGDAFKTPEGRIHHRRAATAKLIAKFYPYHAPEEVAPHFSQQGQENGETFASHSGR
jgi:hypothetical protein